MVSLYSEQQEVRDVMRIIQTLVGPMEVFSYLVFDEETREGILIDPAGDEDLLMGLLKEHGVKLLYIASTHGHADHTCGNGILKRETGALLVMHELDDAFFQMPECQAWAKAMGFEPSPPADLRVRDGDELTFGGHTMRFLHTPGHSPGACCIWIDGNLFTGDTLFVGAVGRTDLPGSSFEQLLGSLKSKILPLPPDTVVWPGHDYGDHPRSTLGDEMDNNPYITDFLTDD
jgi:glyoxylase-like metal-dependent hydrolase (beta-lactamase superfamily II)